MNGRSLVLKSPLMRRRYQVLAGAGVVFLIVALIVVFILSLRRSANRGWAEAFEGVIEEKAIIPHQGRSYSLGYVLVIRQKTGEAVRFPVERGIYEQARVGMPVRKRAGEYWPRLGAAASP